MISFIKMFRETESTANSRGTRCGHIPPLRGWWIHSARSPSRFCCYSFWGRLFWRVHSDLLLRLPFLRLLLASFVSSSLPPGLEFYQQAPTDKQSARGRCPTDRASHYFGFINGKCGYFYSSGEKDGDVSGERCFLCGQIFLAIPRKASPEGLLVLLNEIQ